MSLETATRMIAIPETELEALKERIDSLATSVNKIHLRGVVCPHDLHAPKVVAKRYHLQDRRVYAACESGQLVAEKRMQNGRFVWLISVEDAQRWYTTFIRKQVNQ